MSTRLSLLSLFLLALGGCRPVEARDPSEILAEDPAFMTEEGSAFEDDEEAKPTESAAAGPAATFSDCAVAVRHLQELGVDVAIREETDPARRRELQANRKSLLESDAMKERIRRDAEDCVARGTSRREAKCIAEIQSESGINACSR